MPPITVYSQPSCNPCSNLKRELTNLGVVYVDVDVSEDLDAREAIVAAGMRRTPVLRVGEEMWGDTVPKMLERVKSLLQN